MTRSTLRRIAHAISGVAEKVLGLSDHVLLDLAFKSTALVQNENIAVANISPPSSSAYRNST
jgi:hypothetical protein